MKTKYSSAFLCFFLVGSSSWAQLDQTTVPVADGAATIPLSPAELAVLEAASNAVQAATIIWLPDDPVEASQWSPAGALGTVPRTDGAGAVGVPIQDVSSNGQNTVRLVYQTSPAVVAATMSATLGAARSGNSPQPLDSQGACVRPGSGLVSWWQAENNATDTAGTHNGETPHGVSYVSGEVGQAFSFSGNQSIQIPYSNELATACFTVEAWVKPAQAIGGQAYIFGQAYGRSLVVQPGSGGLHVAFMVTDTNGVFHAISPTGLIPIGQWTHLAGTWDGANLKLYTNGVPARSASLQLPAIGNSGCPFSIGGFNNSCGYSGQYFPGLVDEVSLYDRALFPGEINAIYLAGSAGKCKTAPSCATSPLSAIASWPGEGDASDMFNNCPGTTPNGVSFDCGIVGRAFSFNGTNQSVQVPDASALTGSVFSVEVWVKPSGQIGGGQSQAFIFGQAYGRNLVVRTGNYGLGVAFQISSNSWSFHEVDSSGEIPIGEWTHLVGTWDGAALRLYINGALDQQAGVNIAVWDSGCPFSIGGFNNSCGYSGQYFLGLIDETTYYSEALSAADVAALYNAGEMGKCNSLGYWLEYYFGPDCWNQTYATAYADADGDGDVNIQEYWNATDPNRITFFARLTNLWVNSTTAHGTFDIYGGVPFYMAILTNSTNFAAAPWQAYTPSFTVSLEPTDGVYNVWIGLRGLPPDSQQTWNRTRLTRDLQAPSITITSPAALTVTQPMIDLRGYCPERLLNLYYDVANAARTVTNIQGLITDQYLDPDSHDFTTNWFLCADLELTNGPNTVTLRATDLAGNVSTTVLIYTLNVSNANPPALSLYWPQDGEKVCGDQFTLRGRLDDPTATITAQISDTGGSLNVVKGLVERNGLVWVENLPLAPGINTLTLSMTNAAGYSSFTNFTVIRSDDVNVTIDDVPQDQLAEGLVTVTGTIDSTNFAVWVNGVLTTNVTDNGNGTWHWEAYDVPLNSGGTATIQAVAIPNSVNGGQGTGMESRVDNAVPGNPKAVDRRGKEKDPEQSDFTCVKVYHATYDDRWTFAGDLGGWMDCHYWWADDWTSKLPLLTGPVPANGLFLGRYHEDEVTTVAYPGSDPQEASWHRNELKYLFPQPRGMLAYYTITSSPDGPNGSNWVGTSLWSQNEIWNEGTPYTEGPSYVEGLGWGMTTGTIDRTERIQWMLRTGGKRLPKWQNFFRIWGAATNYLTTPWPGSGIWTPQTVPSESIQVLGKPLIANGDIPPYAPYGMNYKALPDNEEHDITPVVQAERYTFDVKRQKHKLILQHHCVVGGDTTRTDLGVAEQVTLKFTPDLVLNNYWVNNWTTTAGSVSPSSGNETYFTAPSNASPSTVTATLRDEHVDVGFGVVEPSGVHHATVEAPLDYYGLGVSGAGMHLLVYLAPTNVSFYRVVCKEVAGDASEISGYYANWSASYLSHTPARGANTWFSINCDNSWEHVPPDRNWDHAYWANPNAPPQWSTGYFKWVIPGKWKIDGGPEHNIHFSDQEFWMNSAGTVTVKKFDHPVTRPITDHYGTAQ